MTDEQANDSITEDRVASGTEASEGFADLAPWSLHGGLRTPAGWRRIEAYTDGLQVVLLEDPEENDENHNCDQMGCSSLGTHVFWRGEVSR